MRKLLGTIAAIMAVSITSAAAGGNVPWKWEQAHAEAANNSSIKSIGEASSTPTRRD
jgi:hypothetical protein